MSDPISEHRALIDDLIARNPSIRARTVREMGAYSPAEGDERFNQLVRRLSKEDRRLLADMLQKERTDSHFDALVWLSEACVCRWFDAHEGWHSNPTRTLRLCDV